MTSDKGKTWHTATIDHQGDAEPEKHWSWSLWSCKIPVKPRQKTVIDEIIFYLFLMNIKNKDGLFSSYRNIYK